MTNLLFGYSDFERIFTFDSSNPRGFICPMTYDGVYYYLQDGAVVEAAMTPWMEGWRQGDVPEPGYIGMKSTLFPIVNPIYSPTEPGLASYTPWETDPVGDHSFPQNSLDIVETRVSFSSERIYFAMRSADQTYPVNSGFTYYAYMPVLVNPFVDPESDPVVYGLMYTVNLGLVISPGLYKISGTGFDGLTRLGDIQSSITDGWLMLSCALSDLLADADAAEWLDSDYPLFAAVTTTSRITLTSGIQEADYTTGSMVLLKTQEVTAANNHAPELTDLNYQITPDGLYLSSLFVTYADADTNVPREAYLSIDSAGHYPLQLQNPVSPDFAMGTIYEIRNLILPAGWQELQIVFSHDQDYASLAIQNQVSNADQTQSPLAYISLSPNPASTKLKISAELNAATNAAIFNIRGQRIRELPLAAGKTELEVDLESLPSGLYFLRGKGLNTKKFIKY
jgi:hypothetical protein